MFETLLVLDGTPVELEAHLARLGDSVRALYGTELPAQAGELVRRRAVGLAPGRLRLTAAPAEDGSVGLTVVTATVDAADVFPSWERSAVLRPFLVEGGLGPHKWADRRELAELESGLAAGELPLLVDAGEEALECSRANVFALDGEVLLTPPADGRILAGVARARVIEEARSRGIEVREEPLTLDRMVSAAEAFLTGSVRGIEPVRAVADSRLHEPGARARELAAELRATWEGQAERARAASPAG